MTRRLASPNEVRGRPDWYYGLRITFGDGTCEFEVHGPSGQTIGPIKSSRYRTNTAARRMGQRDLVGYQTAARRAIDAATKP